MGDDNVSRYQLPVSLDKVFEAGMKSLGHDVVTVCEANSTAAAAAPVDKEKAEKHKAEGQTFSK